MFRSKTLFVVGAGASNEVDLPVGTVLKNHIATKLDIRFEDGFRQKSGDYEITEAFRRLQRDKPLDPRRDINSYLAACWMIRDAMPQASSIDVYIDAHRDNGLVEACGKLGIASSILDAERHSRLYLDPREMKKMDFARIADTWFSRFFEIALDRVSEAEVDAALENVSFVTFNYDRCIEHFLVAALMNYYGITEHAAQDHARHVRIYHPYGSVGFLPWQGESISVPFGVGGNGAFLISSISRLKTFTERIEEGDALAEMRTQVERAETVIFLGFAFHRQNLELIRPRKANGIKRIFATAMGISNADCIALEAELKSWTRQKAGLPAVHLRNDLSCEKLFCEYRRTLSAL